MLIDTITNIKVYKALIAANDVGKRFGLKSLYNMLNGMIVFAPYEIHEIDCDTESYDEYDNSIVVGFIHDKLLIALEELVYIPMIINGDDLYSTDKLNGKGFKCIEVHDNCIKILYDADVVETMEEVQAVFMKEWLVDHPTYEFTPEALSMDVVMIGAYRKFILLYEPKTNTVPIEYIIDTLSPNVNDTILAKVVDYKNKSMMYQTETVHESVFDEEYMNNLITSARPIKHTVNIDGVDYTTRMMKSMFPGYNKTSTVSMKTRPIDSDTYQNIIVIRGKNATICALYEMVIY